MNFWKTLGISFALFILFFGIFGIWVFLQIPSASQIKGCLVTKMYQVHLCPGSKEYVPLSRISPFLQRAIVMSEDAAFWNHKGFDWDELQKSFELNWKTGSYARGGSTITQQLAKNLFLSKDKTITRKGIEALITMRLEEVLTKKEILERYLNVVEFGRNIYGIKAASFKYFGKPPSDLDAVESAFIAMLLPNPVKYSSSHQQKNLTAFARKRVQRILNDMVQTGKMTQEQYEAAVSRIELFLNPEAVTETTEPAFEDIENMDFKTSSPETTPAGHMDESANELSANSVDSDIHENPPTEQDDPNMNQESPSDVPSQN